MITADKQIKVCAYLCYLVALLIGVAVGTVMFTYSFIHNRESRITVYGDDINIWNNTKRSEFANNTFKISASGSTNYVTLMMQETESLEHNIQNENNLDLPSYSPLYYNQISDSSSYGIQQIKTFNANDTIKFNIVVGEGNNKQIVTSPAFPLYSVKSMNVASSTACIKLNGHYESTGGTCFMYSIISNVCLQVDKDDGGNWYLNKNKMTGESGCYSQHHNTTQYTQIVLSGGSKIDDVYPYTVGKVTWELRSAYDPWLVAMVLTEDTKNFGMSALELRYIGICLIICCAGLTIMPICWFYTLCKNGSFFYSSKNRRYQYRPENIVGDEETPKGGLSRGIPPRNIGLDKNNIDIIIEGDEPESEREQNLSKLSKSVKQVNKKPARNGEYESYYQ